MSGFQWTELRLKNRSLYLFGQLSVLLFFLVKSFLHLHVDDEIQRRSFKTRAILTNFAGVDQHQQTTERG